jgi:hypothetical protein
MTTRCSSSAWRGGAGEVKGYLIGINRYDERLGARLRPEQFVRYDYNDEPEETAKREGGAAKGSYAFVILDPPYVSATKSHDQTSLTSPDGHGPPRLFRDRVH